MQFKPPMLACQEPVALDEVSQSDYLYQPKFDGIRVVFYNGVPLTRTGKLIPNVRLRTALASVYAKSPWNGLSLDGELLMWNPLVNDYMPFNTIQSLVMSERASATDWVYNIFDHVSYDPFEVRWSQLLRPQSSQYAGRLFLVLTTEFPSLINKAKYEGIMLRKRSAPYKHGRVTRKEGYLLKHVDWMTDEATVVSLEQEVSIDGEPKGTLGALVVKHPVFGIFNIGTGFTAMQRKSLYTPAIVGKTVTFKYRPGHIKDAPCPAVFVGFRDTSVI